MIGVKFNSTDLIKTLNNTVQYTQGFLTELKRQEPALAKKVGDLSIDVFYEYLDGLARSHPGMLHHVYEWGQVGNPSERLYELRQALSKQSSTISVNFLDSNSVSDNGTEPFYDKAKIMEEGIPVVINEKNANVLFFEIDGEEFFRRGPIYIANPGGSATRGSFLNAFNEFYTKYFMQFYLESIGFYKHFSNPQEFSKNFRSAVKSRGASKVGNQTALSWINKPFGGTL
jgi:hypothetical protein